MKKTTLLPFLFTGLIACDSGDSLLSYEPEAGATYLALSDGLPPDNAIPHKEIDLDDAFITNEEESLNADALACDATLMRSRFLKIRDRLEEGDLGMPLHHDQTQVNEDGSLNRRQKHRRQMRQKIMKRIMFIYDLDGDRTLNEEERNRILEDLNARCENVTARVLEHFDADEDGILSETERAAAKAAWRTKKEEKRNAFRAAADTDEDGEISETERRAIFEARRIKHREKRQALKERFDTDEDGVLSPSEKEALRWFLRQKIRMDQVQEKPIR